MELHRSIQVALASRSCRLGAPLVVSEETASTNDDAKAAAKAGAPDGALFVAERQTRGRGRGGHTWYAEPGSSLTFSLVLRPDVSLQRLPGLALVAGLAVAAAVEGYVQASRSVQVKWPNDVWIDGKKVCGVLVEALSQGDRAVAVVGIGVNVSTRAFPPELEARATSIGEGVPRAKVLADVVFELERRLPVFYAGGLAPFADELSRRDALLGQRVAVEGVVGVARGVDASGALLVETERGVVPVFAGEVQLSG